MKDQKVISRISNIILDKNSYIQDSKKKSVLYQKRQRVNVFFISNQNKKID